MPILTFHTFRSHDLFILPSFLLQIYVQAVTIFSREVLTDDISKLFKTLQRLTRQCNEAEAAIPNYIDGIIQDNIKCRDFVVGNHQLLQEAQNVLIQGSDGM